MTKPSGASARKPRALFVSPEAPYPLTGGGALRSASLLEYLARRFAVHVIVFREAGTPDPARTFPAGLVDRLDVLELPYHSKRPSARAWRNALRLVRGRPPLMDRFSGFEAQIAAIVSGSVYDAAILEHFWCAPYVAQLRPYARHVTLDLHNIESDWHRSLAEAERGLRGLALRRFGAAVESLERQWLPQFDRILVTCCQDAELVPKHAAAVPRTVYPNALPEIALPVRHEFPQIIFTGNLEYQPNIAAVRFFRKNIWPQLRIDWPALHWKIAGKSPNAIRRLVADDPRIEFSGAMEDAVAVLAQAQVAVVPVLAGSGTRVKILEAWAAGTPVVSTTLGAQGLECRDREHLLLEDDPCRFAAAVSHLLASEPDRARIGAAGRRLYEERYTWPAAWKTLDGIWETTSPGTR